MTIPLIIPVMGISWPCILEKECFDMVRNIGYWDFVRVFSSSRRYDRVYLGWFIFNLVCRLFMREALRWSEKAHYRFGSIGSCLSTGFQVQCVQYVFFHQFFCLISSCWSCYCLSQDWVPSLHLISLGSVYLYEGNGIQFFGSRIWFLCSLLFSG